MGCTDALEGLLHNIGVVAEAARHHTAEDEIKGLRPRPLLLKVIDLPAEVSTTLAKQCSGVPRAGYCTSK